MRLFLTIGLIALAAYLAPAAWFLFNIAMRNPTFAEYFVLVGAIVVLAGMWEVISARWLP